MEKIPEIFLLDQFITIIETLFLHKLT
jgi:hypothetical protein